MAELSIVWFCVPGALDVTGAHEYIDEVGADGLMETTDLDPTAFGHMGVEDPDAGLSSAVLHLKEKVHDSEARGVLEEVGVEVADEYRRLVVASAKRWVDFVVGLVRGDVHPDLVETIPTTDGGRLLVGATDDASVWTLEADDVCDAIRSADEAWPRVAHRLGVFGASVTDVTASIQPG